MAYDLPEYTEVNPVVNTVRRFKGISFNRLKLNGGRHPGGCRPFANCVAHVTLNAFMIDASMEARNSLTPFQFKCEK